LADHKSFISSLNNLFNKEHDDFSCLYWITKRHNNLYIILQVLILFQDNSLTAVTDGIQSYWDTIYSGKSFNRMRILKYWIFWIILIIVLFQKWCLSKHVTVLRFTNRSSWECIQTFNNIINNAVICTMVRNVTNLS
jgi:hypothetical protein